ncbi:hypothetical protein GmHk_03G007168 [Glycine max]|nr:hypothetical protein GmHk_03G007168 [Glycine max]
MATLTHCCLPVATEPPHREECFNQSRILRIHLKDSVEINPSILSFVATLRLIRQVCEVLILICSLSQSTDLASHPLSAPLFWLSVRKNQEAG